jgi:hypothetical protein
MVRFRSVFAGLLVLALATGLAACRTPQQALDKGSGGEIKKIALIPCAEPEKYRADNGGHPGLAFGLIGGAIAAQQMAENAATLTIGMHDQQLCLGAVMTDAVEAALRAQNYEVVRITAASQKPGELMDNYNGIQTDADAILDLALPMAGYIKPGIALGYGPSVRLAARMVRPGNGHTLFSDEFSYGRASVWDDATSSDDKYKLSDFDDVKAALPLVKEGLEKGTIPLAEKLVTKLR